MNKEINEEQRLQYFPMLYHSVISVQDIECAIENLDLLKIC